MFGTHAAAWDSESPSPAQLKELFAQIEKNRVTKVTLTHFLRKGDPGGSAGAHYYATGTFFHFLVNGLGPKAATDIVIDSKNSEWMVQLAGNCMDDLSLDLKLLLANEIVALGDTHAAYNFFRCITGVPQQIRKQLLDASFVVDADEKERLLAQPATGF